MFKKVTNGEVSVKRMERTIRALNGTIQKLVSFDGVHWRLKAKENKEARRLQSAANLRGKAWLKKQESHLDALKNPGVERNVFLSVPKHQSPILGKDQGKKQKYKRNLRAKHEQEVTFMRAVHKHRCHGKQFLCSCDTPYFRRFCGGSECLHLSMAFELHKLTPSGENAGAKGAPQ